MKKILLFFVLTVLFLCTLGLVGCGTPPPAGGDGDSGLKTITGVSFVSKTCDYDGTEKELLVTGSLPAGVSVEYTNNKGTNANVYNASAFLSGEGYKSLTLNATLTINKATFDVSTVSWDYSSPYTYDGTQKQVALTNLPQGLTVKSYSGNVATNANSYIATATFEYDTANYNAPNISSCSWVINKANYDMSNVKWNYVSAFSYDGTQKEVVLTNLPQGISVKSYSNNTGTDANTYEATALFDYDTNNYNQPRVESCLWTINLADILGISINSSQSITEDGENHLPTYTGNIPAGVLVEYFFDNVKDNDGVNKKGTYSVKIVFSGKNYKTLTLECTFKIKLDIANLALKVFSAFGSTPSPWSFLPKSFAVSNKTIDPANIPDYTNFVDVSNIPTNGIGKQLSVVYNTLNKTTKALTFVQPIYDVLGTIKNLYTTFLDGDPENYKEYSNTVAGINFTLALTETQYLIKAQVKGVSVQIFADQESKGYGAKVQLTETTVLKYTVLENSLTMALNILDTAATLIEFVRNDYATVGYMYEYLGIGSAAINTSAMIHITDDFTTLIGTKGDFIPTAVSRNCEVYENATGKLVGSEVKEELDVKGLGIAEYNTLWYHLNTLDVVKSIKKIDEANGLNADKIYINQATESIHTKTVSVLPTSKKAYSRRFDIEFKKMYFYTYNSETEEYEEVTVEIPMLFVQEENLSTFEADFYEKNADYITGSFVTLSVPSKNAAAVEYGYHTLVDSYNEIKNSVSLETIQNYCS